MAKFEVTKRKNGEFQFNLKGTDDHVLLKSEGYVAKVSCLNGIESVKKNALEASKFDKKVASDGQFYFNLKATNGQVIGTSLLYDDEIMRDEIIKLVKKSASKASVVEKL